MEITSSLSYTPSRAAAGGVAIQSLWIASSLMLLATTDYAKVSLKGRGLGEGG